jgi:hypothetical protein
MGGVMHRFPTLNFEFLERDLHPRNLDPRQLRAADWDEFAAAHISRPDQIADIF